MVVVCAGNGKGSVFSEEDFAAAGVIAAAVAALGADREVGAQARAAMLLDASREIANATHAGLLRDLGLGADVEFCLRRDTSRAVPVVVESGEGWALLRDAAASGP